MPRPVTDPETVPPLTSPSRPTWLEIDLAAIVHNFQTARRTVDKGVAIHPVVKADGYGLGAAPIARALAAAGADGFCVTTLEEGERLRQGGIRQPIILLSGLMPGFSTDLARRLIDAALQPLVYDLATARHLNRAVRPGKPPLPIHLKVNTGMARLGLEPAEVADALAQLTAMTGLRVAGIVSHLACADSRQRPETIEQARILQDLLSRPEIGPWAGRVSLANSAGLLRGCQFHFDWVRPGIMLYGASPFFPQRRAAAEGLKPVLRWVSHIVQIRQMPAGTPLGYGHDHITRRPSRIAQLPVGYADGYSRRLGNRGMVVIDGRRAPVVGRVCMDLTTIDVTDIDSARVGSPVLLLGGDGGATIDIEQMALWMETIPYEVLCRLGARLPRYYSPASPVVRKALQSNGILSSNNGD